MVPSRNKRMFEEKFEDAEIRRANDILSWHSGATVSRGLVIYEVEYVGAEGESDMLHVRNMIRSMSI